MGLTSPRDEKFIALLVQSWKEPVWRYFIIGEHEELLHAYLIAARLKLSVPMGYVGSNC